MTDVLLSRPMYLLLMLGAVSFALTFVLTPLIRNVCVRWGLVDKPDQGRKLHPYPIPRAGGIPIFISFFASQLVLFAVARVTGSAVGQGFPLMWNLVPAAATVFFTGLLDDLRGLKPWEKLAGQIVAASLAYMAGVRIAAVGGHAIPVWLGCPLTIVWLVGCANAFNLIDGVDGLACGIGLFSTITTAVAAVLNRSVGLATGTVALGGALLGFLRYNFNPASIFLGDCGSLLIGFLLGCYGVLWSHKATTALAMTAPLMALAIPLLDTALSIARRFLRGQPIFTGDRGHIHHRLLERGLTPRRVVLTLYLVCGVAATFSLLLSVAHRQLTGLVVVLFGVVTWVGIQKVGYIEFNVARRVMSNGAFGKLVNGQINLEALERSLAQALTVDDLWRMLRGAGRSFGFQAVRLSIDSRMREAELLPRGPEPCWELNLPLGGSDHISFARQIDCAIEPMAVCQFADIVHRTVRSKLAEVRPQVAAQALRAQRPPAQRAHAYASAGAGGENTPQPDAYVAALLASVDGSRAGGA